MDKEIFKVYADTRYNPSGALWEVSNFGSVRKNGEEYLPYVGIDNYLRFGHNFILHRAVAELFIPNPTAKSTVDHINRDKHDNRVSNLRWATHQEQEENKDWETIRMKISASQKGKKKSEEARAKNRAAHLGKKTTLGKIWVSNPTTEHLTMVNPSQLPDYLAKGYIKGRKLKK